MQHHWRYNTQNTLNVILLVSASFTRLSYLSYAMSPSGRTVGWNPNQKRSSEAKTY